MSRNKNNQTRSGAPSGRAAHAEEAHGAEAAQPARTGQELPLDAKLDAYAELLVRLGLNVQPGQAMTLSAELEHAAFARRVVRAAYRAGARYVDLNWRDDLLECERVQESAPEALDYVPDFVVTRARQMTDEAWPALYLAGPATPDAFESVDATLLTRMRQARRRKTRFSSEAVMADKVAWCVAAVPTLAWAQKVFPNLPPQAALARLWETVLSTVRMDQPDPIAAWAAHSERLSQLAAALNRSGVRTLHFVDLAPGPDGLPATDLAVGLTEAPVWIAAAAQTPEGTVFLPNIPTEEIFTTPHMAHVEGYVRTSKPGFPLERRVDGACFHFRDGEVVEASAEVGQDALDAFLRIPGANRMGEISLVDEGSPINRTGILFHETLFDENCVSHFALGKAYPKGVLHGESMTESEQAAIGINDSDTHVDFMLGTPTMQVTGIRPDGSEVPIMVNGRFVLDLNVENATVAGER